MLQETKQETKQETNIFTTSLFWPVRKIIYVILFLFLGWCLSNYIKSIIRGGQATLLYKLADVENRSITQVIEHLDLGHGGIEEPFKQMFFMSKDKLLIKYDHYQFLEVDLLSKTTREVTIDNRPSCWLAGISQNKNGLIYLTYYDGFKRHYSLMQYNFPNWFRSESVRKLVEDMIHIEGQSNLELKVAGKLEEVSPIQSSKSQDQEFKINGTLNEVSPHEQFILYQVPADWSSSDGGELYKGILKALHVPTGEIIEIMRNVRYKFDAHFLNDYQVAVPREGQIEIYNLDTEQWEEEALMRYNQDYALLKFSLNEDRTKAAILLIDFASRRGNAKQPDSNDKVELRVIDFKNHQEYVVDHDFDSEVACEYAGDILWHGHQIVYSVLNQLYYYQLGNPQQIFITDHLGTYSIKGNDVVYSILGEDWLYTFKSFSLIDFATRILASEDGNLENTGNDKRILYKSNHLTIEYSPEIVKAVAKSGGWYDIVKQKLIINSY